MAALGVIMPMIAFGSTAANIIGIIKRRCGASDAITELATKCTELVDTTLALLKTLEDGARVPQDTRGISIALQLRCEQFDTIMKNLDKMNRRIERSKASELTKKFILSQGWAKKMEAIYNDLVDLRNGVETLVSSWEVANLVTKVEQIVAIKGAKKRESRRWKVPAKSEVMRMKAVNVEQYVMVLGKLNEANKAALDQHGKLEELSLPDALCKASYSVADTDETCCFQLICRSAELLHPCANYFLGLHYEDKGNLELAVPHFRITALYGVSRFEEKATEAMTKKNKSRNLELHAKREMKGGRTVDVDQYLRTINKLNQANRSALDRYGKLDESALPEAMYEVSFIVQDTDEACSHELLKRSAELFHPSANYLVGLDFQREKNFELALLHFDIASSRGNINSMIEMMNYYDIVNDREGVLKYVKMMCNTAMTLVDWAQYVHYAIAYSFETTQLVQPLTGAKKSDYVLQKSVCSFFGAGVPKRSQDAIETLRNFDSDCYDAELVVDESNRYFISANIDQAAEDLYHVDSRHTTEIRHYTDFLLKQNQTIPFLFFSYSTMVYPPWRWKHYALRAASKNFVYAHILLADHYSWDIYRDEREMELHIRIAAYCGRSDAEHICRRLYGKRASIARGLGLGEERSDGNEREEKIRRTRSFRGDDERVAHQHPYPGPMTVARVKPRGTRGRLPLSLKY